MHEAHYFQLDGRLGFAEVFGTTGPPVLCVHTAGQNKAATTPIRVATPFPPLKRSQTG